MAQDLASLQRSYEDLVDLQLQHLRETLLQQYKADLSQLAPAKAGAGSRRDKEELEKRNSSNEESFSENGPVDLIPSSWKSQIQRVDRLQVKRTLLASGLPSLQDCRKPRRTRP